jgi:hypothetical protein
MKKIMLFEQFMNEYWKSGDKSFVSSHAAEIEKVGVNKRLKTFILSKGPEDAPFGDAGEVNIMGWSKNQGIAEPFLDDTNYGPETDTLYYPIANKTKLEEVKNWMLTWWDISHKDFIKQVDKSKNNDHWFSMTGTAEYGKTAIAMVMKDNLKEPGSLKKYAKHLDADLRSTFFKDMNFRVYQLIGDCYSISGSAKEMEMICKQMRNEFEKQLDSYINTVISSNDAGIKFRDSYAKKVGFVKYQHSPVDPDLFSHVPKSEDATNPGPDREALDAKGIRDLPEAPGMGGVLADDKLHSELREKGIRIKNKLIKNYNPYKLAFGNPNSEYLELYEFDFLYGDTKGSNHTIEYPVCYGRVDMLNLEITLIDESNRQWNSGKLNKINAKIIDEIMQDKAPEENDYQLNI